MTNYETFAFTVGYIAFILFALAVIGIGGILTLISLGVCLVSYYPIKFYTVGKNWVDDKFRKEK